MNILDITYSGRFDLDSSLLPQVLNNEFYTKLDDNLKKFWYNCDQFIKRKEHTRANYENILNFFIDSTNELEKIREHDPAFVENAIANNAFHIKPIAEHLNLKITQMTEEEKQPYIDIVMKLLNQNFYLNILNK